MEITIAENWDEYELLDTGNGKRLERFGKYILMRPDPQIIWSPTLPMSEWAKADAIFERTRADKGTWKFKKPLPESWNVHYKSLTFIARHTPFKHTGIFPEQTAQWDWMTDLITHAGRDISVLNLFGYTGGATLACAAAGASVTHVDASKPAITWANSNAKESGLADKPIRWIPEDALKFTEREAKRGNTYDAIVMDPPVYGHGPKGETWDFNKHFPKLIAQCRAILSDKPLFVLVNTYAISSSALMLQNVFAEHLGDLDGSITVGELALKEKSAGRLLSTGIYGRWQA